MVERNGAHEGSSYNSRVNDGANGRGGCKDDPGDDHSRRIAALLIRRPTRQQNTGLAGATA